MRRKHKLADSVEQMARHLFAAYLDVTVQANQHLMRPHPAWESIAPLGRQGWRAVALCLLARGVKLPEDHP